MFNPAIPSVVSLSVEQAAQLTKLFYEMEVLLSGEYFFKFDMIRNLLQIIILEGIRLQGVMIPEHINERLISKFFHLLNQQFPVDSPENPLLHSTPAVYASQLHVHVNHLNNVLKKSTGKTTREIIHERIVDEAKNLLLNTDWDAAQIAYTLGFEYPSHFNKYFKQSTHITPLYFREQGRLSS